jgi:putative transposase
MGLAPGARNTRDRPVMATAMGSGDPVLRLPPEVRRIIYTTNAIESLNSTLRTAVRSRRHFPTDEAAIKLLYLALRRVSNDWKNAQREWTAAMTQLAIMFGDRFSVE